MLLILCVVLLIAPRRSFFRDLGRHKQSSLRQRSTGGPLAMLSNFVQLGPTVAAGLSLDSMNPPAASGSRRRRAARPDGQVEVASGDWVGIALISCTSITPLPPVGVVTVS
jgi:hypothetical protein